MISTYIKKTSLHASITQNRGKKNEKLKKTRFIVLTVKYECAMFYNIIIHNINL